MGAFGTILGGASSIIGINNQYYGKDKKAAAL
jgi:hypothetical protein